MRTFRQLLEETSPELIEQASKLDIDNMEDSDYVRDLANRLRATHPKDYERLQIVIDELKSREQGHAGYADPDIGQWTGV